MPNDKDVKKATDIVNTVNQILEGIQNASYLFAYLLLKDEYAPLVTSIEDLYVKNTITSEAYRGMMVKLAKSRLESSGRPPLSSCLERVEEILAAATTVYMHLMNKLYYSDIFDDIIRFLSIDNMFSHDPLHYAYRDHILHSLNVTKCMIKIVNDVTIDEIIPRNFKKWKTSINEVARSIHNKISSYDNFKDTEEYREFGRELGMFLNSTLFEYFKWFVILSAGLLHDLGYAFEGDPRKIVSMLKFKYAFYSHTDEKRLRSEDILKLVLETLKNTAEKGIDRLAGKGIVGLIHPVLSAYIILRRVPKGNRLYVLRKFVATVILRHKWCKGDLCDDFKYFKYDLKDALSSKNRGKNGNKNLETMAERYPFATLLYLCDELS
ncbi:hypothetical protein [Pyrodictium abyssi]|uniref:hypothetical protein n=1 Tax=Pyrodictium abyssi TaxID=54256 RepID=UPI0030C6AE1A